MYRQLHVQTVWSLPRDGAGGHQGSTDAADGNRGIHLRPPAGIVGCQAHGVPPNLRSALALGAEAGSPEGGMNPLCGAGGHLGPLFCCHHHQSGLRLLVFLMGPQAGGGSSGMEAAE